MQSDPQPPRASDGPKKKEVAKKRKREVEEEVEDEEEIHNEMKDFIVPDEDADRGIVGDAEDDEDPRALTEYAAVIAKSTAFDTMGTVVNEQGLRRSARANKGVPPKVYVDEDYAALMLEGADPEEIFKDSDSDEEEEDEEEEDEDDSTAADRRRVRELDESDDEDDGGPDEPEEDEDFEPEEEEDDEDDDDDDDEESESDD